MVDNLGGATQERPKIIYVQDEFLYDVHQIKTIRVTKILTLTSV